MTDSKTAGSRTAGSARRLASDQEDPTGSERELLARIGASARARSQRTLLVAVGTLSVLVLLISGSGWVLSRYLGDQFARVDAGTTGTPDSGPLNILLAGVDIRSGLTPGQQARLHVGSVPSHNSDTLMIIHVYGDHRHVEAISLPRDSWVNIPGYGMNKINAAIGFGGPSLVVQTVQQLTGLTINDFVEVNFLGFVRLIDAIGGVNICLPFAVSDPYSGLRLSAGRHHVDGITALQFARDRHSFARSDLDRIFDQQQLMATVASQAINSGTLSDPARISRLFSALTSVIKIDQHLNVIGLATELRNVRPSLISFTTVPLEPINYVTPTGLWALLWNQPAASALFARIRSDQLTQRKHPAKSGSGSQSSSATGAPVTANRAACR